MDDLFGYAGENKAKKITWVMKKYCKTQSILEQFQQIPFILIFFPSVSFIKGINTIKGYLLYIVTCKMRGKLCAFIDAITYRF